MKSHAKIWLWLALIVASAACTQSAQNQQQNSSGAPGSLPGPCVVINETVLRLAPTDDDHVAHPRAPDKQVTNYIGHLIRGHLATVRRQMPSWSEIVLDDDAEGWVHTNDLMPAADVSEATVMADTIGYGAASRKAPRAAVVTPGTLLFIAEEQGEFSKVYGETGEPVYVETGSLARGETDLAMSHLILRMRAAKGVNDMAEASELLDEARIKYAKSPLIDALAENVDFMHTHEPPRMPHSRVH